MKTKILLNKFGFIFVLTISLFLSGEVNSQSVSSFYMMPETYQANMLNPALGKQDQTIVISVLGLGGGTLGNSGNFKFSDVIRRQPSGEMAVDLEHLYNLGNANINLKDWASVPVFYVGLPTTNGRLSFYYKEQLYSLLDVKTETIEFFLNGNSQEKYRNFNTEDANINALGYKEFAAGYSTTINEKIQLGFRGKLLFGTMYAELNDWEYGIETIKDGEAVRLSSKGSGYISLPRSVTMEIRNNQLREINTMSVVRDYFGSYSNPGLALDLGINYNINKQQQFSIGVTDMGIIRFSNNSITVDQDSEYEFTGFELSQALDSKRKNEFVSYHIMENNKNDIRDVFRLSADFSKYLKSIPPKVAIHYQNKFSGKLSLGVTNQTAFYKNNTFNIFSIGARQNVGNFSIFENINLYGINQLAFGGGIMWEGKHAQVVFATDNLLAIYHPANQKSYIVSAGINLLFNKPEKSKKSEGKFSPHFPFYKIREK